MPAVTAPSNRTGRLVLALSASRRRRYVSEAEACASAGKKRRCPAAKRRMSTLIAMNHEAAKREVEALLGVPCDATKSVILSCYEICHPVTGAVIAKLKQEVAYAGDAVLPKG